MRPSEFGNFKSSDYQSKISATDSYSRRALKHNIYRKRAQLVSGMTAYVSSIAITPPTCGIGIFAFIYTVRRVNIAAQKLTLLKAEWKRRGLPKLRHRMRDFVIPAAIGILILDIVTVFYDAGAENVSHAGSNAFENLATNPTEAVADGVPVDAFADGVTDGFHEAVGLVTGQPLDPAMVTGITPDADAYAAGVTVGLFAAQSGATHGAEFVSNKVREMRGNEKSDDEESVYGHSKHNSADTQASTAETVVGWTDEKSEKNFFLK